MEILGGTSTSNGSIIYYSENYEASATINETTKEIDVTFNKNYLPSDMLYKKIPVIRSIIDDFHQTFFRDEKFVINLLPVLCIFIYIIDKVFLKFNVMNYLYGLFYIFLFYYISHSESVAKLHGAEHAVYNSYLKDKKLNDIDAIRNENLTVDRCGTTAYVLILVIFYISGIFVNDFIIQYLLAIGISIEIVKLIENEKHFKIIGKPIILLSKFLQKSIFTKKPDEIHVKAAIMVIRKLEELEENHTE